MGVLEIPFNPANIMTLPLVIGIGVTSGIHILNRFSEEGTASVLDKSTGKAVLISAVTTVVRLWQPRSGPASGDREPGPDHGDGDNHVHDRGVDCASGSVTAHGDAWLATDPQKTQ